MIGSLPNRGIYIHLQATTASLALCLISAALPALAQPTGTFVDRLAPNDLRVVSYNIYFDSIFTDTNPTQAAKFARVMQALDPDILNLQEVYSHSAANVVGLMNSILPQGDGSTWHAHKASDNIIVSRYPLALQAMNTNPASPRSISMALVDLPNERYETDFYVMNNHYRCCGTPNGPEVAERQRQSDALVNWMRDARSPGEFATLANGTPMAVVGDLNMVESLAPLTNLLAGNIVNEGTYGADSPPDWDGTSLVDAKPLHNSRGSDFYTWRDDNQIFAPGQLDFIIYTDSVARSVNQFVLNTIAMTPSELAATGMQTYDVTLTASNYDHLPVVVDLRFPADGSPGDYNLDRVVDQLDHQLWQRSFGASSNDDADGNGNNQVDAADYVVWRKLAEAGSGGVADGADIAVPEPASNLLPVLIAVLAAVRLRARLGTSRPPCRRNLIGA
jgi:endonuclease/exonuclease/phosphatase family metal-dependent hydrolase